MEFTYVLGAIAYSVSNYGPLATLDGVYLCIGGNCLQRK